MSSELILIISVFSMGSLALGTFAAYMSRRKYEKEKEKTETGETPAVIHTSDIKT